MEMEDKTRPKGRLLAMGVATGFVAGAILGGLAGIATRDLAVWLSIGIGCGIAAGAGIGLLSDSRKK